MGGARSCPTGTNHLCRVGCGPNGDLMEPILGPKQCGPPPWGLISLLNNSGTGHSEDKLDAARSTRALQQYTKKGVCGPALRFQPAPTAAQNGFPVH